MTLMGGEDPPAPAFSPSRLLQEPSSHGVTSGVLPSCNSLHPLSHIPPLAWAGRTHSWRGTLLNTVMRGHRGLERRHAVQPREVPSKGRGLLPGAREILRGDKAQASLPTGCSGRKMDNRCDDDTGDVRDRPGGVQMRDHPKWKVMASVSEPHPFIESECEPHSSRPRGRHGLATG